VALDKIWETRVTKDAFHRVFDDMELGRQEHNGWNAFRSKFANVGFPDRVIAEMTDRMTTVTLERDARIFARGASSEIVFAVLSGWAKTYLPGRDRRILLKIVGPGEFVGYGNCSTDDGPAQQIFEARAGSRCSVGLLTWKHLRRALRQLDPAVLIDMVAALNNRPAAVAARFATLLALPFSTRLEFVLRELAEEFGVRDSRGVIIRPELSHQDLADMIGSSRPMVTRLLLKLVDDGIITRVGRSLVLLGDNAMVADAQ
jgi:CRP-like cAMP-binding protein